MTFVELRVVAQRTSENDGLEAVATLLRRQLEIGDRSEPGDFREPEFLPTDQHPEVTRPEQWRELVFGHG